MSRLMENLSSFPGTASTSQVDNDSNSESTSSRKLRVTLLSSEWRSTKGGLSTINRELAIQLAKHPTVDVSVYLPQCSEEDKRAAASHNVHLIEAEEMPGLEPDLWLSCLPEDHAVDCVIGHGAILGRQVQIIKRHHHCKWIQVVHTAPEELGMYKSYADAISKGEKKHQAEVKLCEKADQVVAVGPKLAEAFSGYLRVCGKDQDVLDLTPGIFSEFADVKQATEERKTFSVLVFGRGDNEDFQLKGYDIAARAIAELKDEPQPYKLLFVGAPSGEEEKVKDLLLQQGIDRSQLTVRCFNESREQLARLFCEVDLVIMPSRTEGFGLAGLEALSAGLPVLVSGNSGLGEALEEVPTGSNCVVESEDPNDWAKTIKAVRKKKRKLRLREAKLLQGEYAEIYRWQDHCKRLVQRMLDISQGPTADEQNLSKKATVIMSECHDEKPSPSEKRLHKGSAKKRQSSKKGKRPLSSSNIPAPKYPRLLKDEDSSKRLTSLDKGKRPLSPSDTPASKQPRLLRYADTENSGVLKMLRAEYERRAKLKPLSWLNTMQLPLKNVYTRLKIISRRKADFQVENDELGMYDIFQALDESEDVKMTLAEGSPGTGKTTFCLKLAYDWARGEMPTNCSFPKFEFVLLLKCRDINGDLMEAIKEQLLPEDIKEETWTKLSDFITNIDNQERILIILDGLDELPEKSRPCVHKLLNRKILPFCYVLATSRQETGIEVRKNCEFDLLLEIKGFTDEDAFQYIRKHFQNIGPEHTSKGESLIVEIKENGLLNALRNNPLNVILLCVVYEDYKGKLPTAQTELYQVVVQCLLRRYCAKQNLVAPEDNSALEKQFEENILALGELAWLCLLSERHGFRENELAALEIRYKGLVARDIGLLYKEESLRRLKPQHEYFFLHKTFQEYLAAAFIAHKLRKNEFNLFERLSFCDLVLKYREVFLFVSGLLERDASILFSQIGEELKNWGDWDWDSCTQLDMVNSKEDWYYRRQQQGEAAASFFAESFSESGRGEQMAVTLCSYIPFPQHVEVNLLLKPILERTNDASGNIFKVLESCNSFQNLQKPDDVTVYDSFHNKWDYETVAKYIQSCSQLQILTLYSPAVTSDLAKVLHSGLSGNTTLSEFTLQVSGSIPCDTAFMIGEWLAATKSLKKVTFLLDGVQDETWASAIQTGLRADTPFTSVVLEVRGPMSNTTIHALGRLSSDEAMTSFSLNSYGDLQDVAAAVTSRGIARQTALESLDLSVNGNLSLSGANVLQSSLLENRSLDDLKLFVRGEIPDNWQFVVENVRLAKKGSVTCTFHPDPGSGVTCNQVAHFHPAVVENGLETKQHLTVVIWGELKCDGAEALCEILVRVPLTSLTLKLHGKLSDSVADIIARYVRQQNKLLSLKIDTSDELSPRTGALLQGLSNDLTVQVKVREVSFNPNESFRTPDLLIAESPASLTPVLSEVKKTEKEKITLRIVNDAEVAKDWPHLLGDALAENTTLTALDLTVNNYIENKELGRELGISLLRSCSLTVLNLAIINYSNVEVGWECTLVNSLARMTSLTTLSLAIDDRGEVRKFESENDNLIALKSLTTLSVVINGSNLDEFWSNFLRKCLEGNTSMKKLCLVANNVVVERESDIDFFAHPSESPEYWGEGLADGLARTTSLNDLALIINNITSTDYHWATSVCMGLSKNESVTSLAVTVSDYCSLSAEEYAHFLEVGLTANKSLTTLTLTVNDYSEFGWFKSWARWPPLIHFLHFSLVEITSLTVLNLNLNICSEVSEDWLTNLFDTFVESSSLTTLRLKVNNQCSTGESRLYDFSNLLLKSELLSSFELSVTFYGE